MLDSPIQLAELLLGLNAVQNEHGCNLKALRRPGNARGLQIHHPNHLQVSSVAWCTLHVVWLYVVGKKQPQLAQPDPDYEGDDDFLDELGKAALEDYELTQRSPQLQTGHSNPAQSTSQFIREPVKESGSQLNLLRSELNAKTEKLQELEEKGYEKDGEVKLLRSELKKKDDQLRELHSKIVSEQKQKEEQFERETKSLSTQLEFKEQELAALKERCSSLELRHKQQPSTSHTSPILHSRPPQRQGEPKSSEKTNFLSTENFMPLSQMSQTDITPVHIAHVSKKIKPDQVNVERRSPNLKSTPIPTRNTDTASTDSNVTSKEQGSKSSTPQQSEKSADPSLKTPDEYKPIHLNVPSLEVSSRELLMLLAHPELLKIPTMDDDSDNSSDKEQSSTSQKKEAATSSLPGLFSLLHIPSSSSSKSTSFSSGTGMTTPVSRLQHNVTPPSAGTSLSGPSLEQSSDSLPKTPIRKSRLQLHKPHTCGHTDMSRSRLRVAPDDFPLRKTLSASNTPIHERTTTPAVVTSEPEKISQGLLDSVDVDGLTGSILSLLTDGDTSTVLSMLNQSYDSLTPTSFPSFPPSLSSSTTHPDYLTRDIKTPSVEVRLLEDIGSVVVRYVTEQMEQARASAISAASNFSDLDSVDTQSPKSSIGGSTTSSSKNGTDLIEPSKADQTFVCQSLGILETLVTYSRHAREQLTAPLPPKYTLEDETATETLETKLSKVAREKRKEERVEDDTSEMESSEDTTEQPSTSKPKVIVSFKTACVHFKLCSIYRHVM